jgi:hypothetical protein
MSHFECGQACIGQRGHSIDTRLKENNLHTWLEHQDKLAVVGFSNNIGDYAAPSFVECITREVIEIELCPNHMNREDGFCLSKS